MLSQSIKHLVTVVLFSVAILAISITPVVQAADVGTMYLDPATATVEEGETFTVQVRANTVDANAALVEISYPSSSLLYVGYNLTGSAFTNQNGLTVSPGSYSNSLYNSGGAPDVSGDILLLTLTFEALASTGTATIDILDSSCTVLSVCVSQNNEDATVTFTTGETPPPDPDPEPEPEPEPTPNAPTETVYTDNQPGAALTINQGEIGVVNGTRGEVTVTCGILKGTGTVGNIIMSCGSVAPGLSPGLLNSGNVTYTGGTYEVELGGTTPGNGDGNHDQLNVTGTVDLGSATTLSVVHWNNFRPALNDRFVIINNDGSDAVVGTFQGLAQGATLTVNGIEYTISYTGGDGNDVVLTTTSVPSVPSTPNTGIKQVSRYTTIASMITLLALAAVFASRKALANKK